MTLLSPCCATLHAGQQEACKRSRKPWPRSSSRRIAERSSAATVPLARIRNRLKITCCSVMLARTVHAQARTAPGSRAQTRSDDALAGSLPQFWSTAGSCRSTPNLRKTITSSSKTGPPPRGRHKCHPDIHCHRFLRAKKIWLSSRALHAVFR